MKLIIKGAALAAALTLTACGGGNEANEAAADNAMTTDHSMAMDPAMMNGMDANATMDANAMGGNATMDANTQNAMMNDMNTNDPDTNLANGM